MLNGDDISRLHVHIQSLLQSSLSPACMHRLRADCVRGCAPPPGVRPESRRGSKTREPAARVLPANLPLLRHHSVAGAALAFFANISIPVRHGAFRRRHCRRHLINVSFHSGRRTRPSGRLLRCASCCADRWWLFAKARPCNCPQPSWCGDIVLLEEGDLVPADCRLIEAFNLRVQYRNGHRRIRAQGLQCRSASEVSPLVAENIVLAGTAAVSGQARAVVYATGMRTEFGKIAHLTQTAGEAIFALAARDRAAVPHGGHACNRHRWRVLLHRSGARPAVLGEPTVHHRHHRCQCAGGPVADGDAVAAMATQRMAKRNALVRHLTAVETLGSTT